MSLLIRTQMLKIGYDKLSLSKVASLAQVVQPAKRHQPPPSTRRYYQPHRRSCSAQHAAFDFHPARLTALLLTHHSQHHVIKATTTSRPRGADHGLHRGRHRLRARPPPSHPRLPCVCHSAAAGSSGVARAAGDPLSQAGRG